MVNKWSLAGDNSKYKLPHAAPAGFGAGFWHGLIAPITFGIGYFKPGVRIYETRNNGRWYDLGFLWGLAVGIGRRSLVIKIDNQKRISLNAEEA